MATLRQHLSGTYFIDYRLNGKRLRKTLPTKSKKMADLALMEFEVNLAKGELGFAVKDEVLEKLFADYLKYSKTHHSQGTQNRYRAILDNFKRFLKSHPHISKISQMDARLFEDYKTFRFEEETSNKTINIELRTIRAMFALAKQWGYIKENPTDGVKFLKVRKDDKPRFLSKEECKKLLAACSKWEYPVFYTFLYTGMRKSELLFLTWNDVDFTRGKIKIKAKEGWVPKTSEREIPINNGLKELLQGCRATRKSEWVFCDERGQQIENNRLRKRLMSITKRCGFGDVTKLHTLRHTFASHLVMSSVDLPTVKKLMGHSDIQTTMIYSHLADEHVDKAVEKLEF